MKFHSFARHLIMLVALVASMNACVIADRQIAAQESHERKDKPTLQYDGPVYFVIPRYYMSDYCRRSVLGSIFRKECRDLVGTRLHAGVLAALPDFPLGKGVAFTDHIYSRGLVCVLTVEKQPLDDTSYSEMLSALTWFVVPSYARHKHILSYSLLLNYEKIEEYQYDITENVITSYVSWLLFPLLYPFWGDIEIGSALPRSGANLSKAILDHDYGPRSKAVEEATRMFFLEARRDGIL